MDLWKQSRELFLFPQHLHRLQQETCELLTIMGKIPKPFSKYKYGGCKTKKPKIYLNHLLIFYHPFINVRLSIHTFFQQARPSSKIQCHATIFPIYNHNVNFKRRFPFWPPFCGICPSGAQRPLVFIPTKPRELGGRKKRNKKNSKKSLQIKPVE